MLRIAIDGTASAGKGSIARGVARELDLPYVDTGSMYRSIALMVIEANKNCHDVTDVLSVLDNVQFDFTWKSDELETWLNGRNVSSKIRSKEVGAMASVVSVFPPVRSCLSALQKSYAKRESLVMDGRDIGTVIIPDAELKVFVDADVNERARRRCEELQRKGEHVLVQEIRQDLVERDHRDRNRAIAPLKQAEDARLLDTTHLTIPEGIKQIVGWVELVS